MRIPRKNKKNAEGEESSLTIDFYEDENGLICKMNAENSEQPVIFSLSRVEKADIADLSTAENINGITIEKIGAGLQNILNMIARVEAAK